MNDQWNKNRLKAILYHYGESFFSGKKVLDLGAGHGEFSLIMANLGATVTCLDARRQHLDAIKIKNPNIRFIRADLDKEWPFSNERFDLTLFLGTANHLKEFEINLKHICSISTNLVLDMQVCDSKEDKILYVKENVANQRHSFNGIGCRPSTSYVELLFNVLGMEYERITDDRCNHKEYVYDWVGNNSGTYVEGTSRFWFAKRHDSIPQLGTVALIQRSTDIKSVTQNINKLLNPTFASTIESVTNKTVPIYLSNNEDKKFVIVIPSYKNELWCEKNITSALNQNYSNFRVIFTDDCSPDNTFNKVNNLIQNHSNNHKCTVIKNDKRRGALANLHSMIHSCADDEIILTLDGDDWFPHDHVLIRLNEVYSTENVWMTYGQYQNSNDGGRGVAAPYPKHVIDNNSFRQVPWGASHLRTFYSWLFKKIKLEDLFYNGEFLSMTWDLAIMFPMLEMAGSYSKYISDILYVYNLDNPINDHKVNVKFQQDLDRYLRRMPKYQRSAPPIFKKNIGLLLIATGKYDRFLQNIITSADKHFLNSSLYNITYYIFTDSKISISTNRKTEFIPIEHKPFPFASMDRYKHFTNNVDKLKTQDYLYYCDVDSLFVADIGVEILGNITAVQHCGYVNKIGPFEDNIKSVFYVDKLKCKTYVGGGFQGGKSAQYLELAKWCYDNIEVDLANNEMPHWHDETALNSYLINHPADVMLSPEFHYPQSNIEHYKEIWGANNYTAKILLLDKNHEEIRK